MTTPKNGMLQWIASALLTVLLGILAWVGSGIADDVDKLKEAQAEERGAKVVERLEKVERKTDTILRTVDRIADKLGVTPAEPRTGG